jgi:8-amino-7-oxononanoate synthase
VPAGTARLRISLSAAHAPDDVERLLAALRAAAPARATAARAMVGAGAQ